MNENQDVIQFIGQKTIEGYENMIENMEQRVLDVDQYLKEHPTVMTAALGIYYRKCKLDVIKMEKSIIKVKNLMEKAISDFEGIS